ncbi:MAG: OmcA/MtrC family decaheme c-type cytochrome, partial [Deltaproteobacteria bacterium]|nr:OmcA/MtrC family decaheme c-type cytochrome [Deltaproteobacteria bacterium]
TVVYDANLTHRLMVGIRTTPSVALQQNGTNLSNFYNEKYFIKDFVPATPAVTPTVQRDMTTTDACNECHGKIGVTTPHGGRGDVKYCMMCHTAQRANGRTPSTSTNGVFTGTTYVADGEVSGDFVTMIHKIHMGSRLTKTGYDYAGVKFNDIVYPKAITNCRQCHKGDTAGELALAPQANNWKEKPSRKSCGSCHDNINFATGANAKVGGAAHPVQANDQFCASCHGTGGPYPVETFHMTENATPNNPLTPAGLVNFYYDVNSVTVADDGTTSVATIKFRIQQNTGSLAAAKSNVVFTGAGSSASTPPADAVLSGFSGSPSFLLAYYKDTANQPATKFGADYNNLGVKAAQPITVSIATLLNGSKGTLTGPDGSGYYTAVLSGAANNFPVGAKLRAVGLQGYFTQISPAAARHALSSVKSVAGEERRDVVDSAKCGNCHEWFEAHGGNRVVGKDTVGQSICTLCHVPNLSTSGRGAQASLIDFIIQQPVTTSLAAVTNFLTGNPFSGTVSQGAKDAMTALVAALGNDPTTYPEASNNFKDMIHGIHSGSDPLVVGTPLMFVRDRGTSGEYDYNFSQVKFPGVLKNCAACHAGTTYTTIPDKAQVSTHVTTSGVPLTLQTAVGVGNNVTQVDLDRKSLPNAQDLVSTPFTATCNACHNRPNAIAHFKTMGGQIMVPRSTANPAGEACATCHGTSGPNAIWNAHRFTVQGE